MFRPDTDLYLLKCPLEMDNNNQLTFANATAQFNYFNSLPKIELEASTYQRKDSTVRYAGNIENLYGYNYCMYRNANYSNKWFYAFVTDLQWANEQTTIVSLKTDVYQTWQFDLTFKASFVEREHVNVDTVGTHTIPENLELGEYVCNGITEKEILSPSQNGTNGIIVIQVTTVTLSDGSGTPASGLPIGASVITGIPQGCYILGVPFNSSNIVQLTAIVGYYDGVGKGDAIVSMYLAPYVASQWTTANGTGTLSGETFYVPTETWASSSFGTVSLSTPTTVNGYTPVNKKLLTAPYTYLYVTNNAGADVEYHYENFTNNAPNFTIYSTIEQGGSSFMMPTNSKVSTNNSTSNNNGWSEGIPAPKLPILSWLSDYYLNWKAVNGSNIEIQALGSALNWGLSTAGVLAGNGGGSYSTANFASDVANIMQTIKEAKITPPQARGNLNSGDVAFASGKCKFTFRNMSIKQEYAEIIDKYFSAFGYRVNAFKLPNRTGRLNWNYVKTVGCNIEGDIPQADMQEIKGIFDSGVTLWHNPSTFLDYSQSNSIV